MPRVIEKEYLHDISNFVSFKLHQSLFYFGADTDKKSGVIVLGVGLVKRIEKGKDFDIVYVDFGNRKLKQVIAGNNHTRRQVYTLKYGQYAWVYGLKRTYYIKGTKKTDKQFKTCIFAKALQGWFVPKQFDIKNMDQVDFDKVSEETQEYINDLLKGAK